MPNIIHIRNTIGIRSTMKGRQEKERLSDIPKVSTTQNRNIIPKRSIIKKGLKSKECDP